MALDMDRPAPALELTLEPTLEPSPALEPVEVKPYDIMEDRDRTLARLADSEEIDRLTSQIDVNDMTSIATFGAETVEEISKASDIVLRSMNLSQMDESTKMLESLARIMSKFNIDDFKAPPKLFGRLTGSVRDRLERILTKYNTMGDEVDRIYAQLKEYEGEIERSNQKLEQMFRANVGYFHELEKYIVAGERGCREIEAYLAQREAEQERTGDQSILFEIQTLRQAKTMLEQRTLDLRTAESVALQSIPMLKIMQYNNMNLVRKINSAFIITLPVFRQALTQAIMLKRQKLQSEVISALDQYTNEMLLKNAKNTAAQVKDTAKLASAPSIQAGTLEKTWRTIVGGIEETRKLQNAARDQRKQDQVQLENIRRDFMAKYNMAHNC